MKTISLAVLLSVFFCSSTPVFSVSNPPKSAKPCEGRTLVVGIDPIPPFAIKTEEGQWHGVTWAIWHLAAAELGWKYKIKRLSLDQIIPSLRSGDIDVAATPFGITAYREKQVDFTVPYYFSAFGVAVNKPKGIRAWASLTEDFLSSQLLKPILIVSAVLLFVSLIFWFCEKQQFKGHKKDGFMPGFWNALLLSSETMTTVGYGENVPRTHLGRLLAIVWMFVSIILVTYFMASVTSSLTTIQLQESHHDLDDLNHIRVGCLAPPSRSARYLEKKGIAHETFDSVREALEALQQNRLDAVVYDYSTLRYIVKTYFHNDLKVLRDTFNAKFFGLVLPADSPLRRPLNEAILKVMAMPVWEKILVSYVGKDVVPPTLPFVEKK